MSEKHEIPKSWVSLKLGELCEVITGNTPPKNDLTNYGHDIPFIKPPYLQDRIIHDTDEKLSIKGSKKARVVPQNTVLVTCIGNLGRTGLTKIKSAFNQQLNAILENELIIGKCIFYQTQSPKFRTQLQDLSAATTVAIVNKGKFETIEIYLPPLPEQHRIVAKIEELFSSLDKGIESLKNAQQQLKVYRQAVLKWAFEGKLTNKNVKEGELPEGWQASKLETVTSKAAKVRRKEQNSNEEFLYIDIGGIDNKLNKIVSYKKYQWKDAPSRAQQIIKHEDTLFSTVRTYLRNIAIVDNLIYDNQICSSGFTVIRANRDHVDPKYLFYYSISEIFIQPLNKLQTGSSYPAVRDDDVFNQYINLPKSPEEQHAIVAEIESRLSVCDKIEESIEQSLKQSEALRQSILKKAFEGKLTEEWRKDHPDLISGENSAAALLAKIKAEKETLRKKK